MTRRPRLTASSPTGFKMAVSRRGFLGYAAGASAAGLAGAAGLGSLFVKSSGPLAGCLLADSGRYCPLPESAAGYATALSAAGIEHERQSFDSLGPARAIVLPAAGRMEQAQLASIRDHLERGSTVLFESGAGYLNSGEFNTHRRLIKSVFGLSLHAPIRLWDSADSSRQSPYVDYRWPFAAKIRDFSRIVPVDSRDGEAIAWFNDLPVAVRRRVGKGTLVFLGSPMGPHLLHGDREAGNWLKAFCSSC